MNNGNIINLDTTPLPLDGPVIIKCDDEGHVVHIEYSAPGEGLDHVFDTHLPADSTIESEHLKHFSVHLSGTKSLKLGNCPKLEHLTITTRSQEEPTARIEVSPNKLLRVIEINGNVNVNVCNGDLSELTTLFTLRLEKCHVTHAFQDVPDNLELIVITSLIRFSLNKIPRSITMLRLGNAVLPNSLTALPSSIKRVEFTDVDHRFSRIAASYVILNSGKNRSTELPVLSVNHIKAAEIEIKGFRLAQRITYECQQFHIIGCLLNFHVLDGKCKDFMLDDCATADELGAVRFVPSHSNLESLSGPNFQVAEPPSVLLFGEPRALQITC